MKKQIKDAKVAKEFLIFIRDAAIKAGFYHRIKDSNDDLTLLSLYGRVRNKTDFADNLWCLITEEQKEKICKALKVNKANFDLSTYLEGLTNVNEVLSTIGTYVPIKALQTLYMYYKDSSNV